MLNRRLLHIKYKRKQCFRKVKSRVLILERRGKLVLRSFSRKQKVNKFRRHCVHNKSKPKRRRASTHRKDRAPPCTWRTHILSSHLSHNVRGHYSLREHTQINLHYRRIFQEISLAAWLKEIVDRIRAVTLFVRASERTARKMFS